MPKSTAYFTAEGINYTYRFCGVTEIEYNFALNIDADTSQGGDIINEARRLPNQIRLSVVETDVEASPGWAASMLASLDSIRRNRVLCTLTTDMGTWGRMFISEITATQDEINQYGWAGDVVFTQYIPRSEQYYSEEVAISTTATTTTSTRRTTNNSSTKKNTGTKAAATSATAGAISAITKLAGAGGGALRLIVAK
ncbi:MAG: hypothetical protein IJQ88_05370 [Clostridia bacterium]|nr:hypothetical protein [Clostridia bacterium]